MAIDSYPSLVENLVAVCPKSDLYKGLVDGASHYYTAKADLGNARARDDPRIEQFETNAQGRYNDLRAHILETNSRLQRHEPPLPPLPVTSEGIDNLVEDIMNDLFKGRKR